MRRVLKVGGSLLLRRDLQQALAEWLDRQSQAETLVIVGGGQLVDAIRSLDRIRPGNPQEIHWLCVDLLETTFRLFASWFDWDRIHSQEALRSRMQDGFSTQTPTLIAVSAFYDRGKASADIPQDWRTTSDTLAALLARRTDADEIVLLKSCPVDSSASIQDLADLGFADLVCAEIATVIARRPKPMRCGGGVRAAALTLLRAAVSLRGAQRRSRRRRPERSEGSLRDHRGR